MGDRWRREKCLRAGSSHIFRILRSHVRSILLPPDRYQYYRMRHGSPNGRLFLAKLQQSLSRRRYRIRVRCRLEANGRSRNRCRDRRIGVCYDTASRGKEEDRQNVRDLHKYEIKKGQKLS